MATNRTRSVRLTGEQMRALIEAARYARDYNDNLSEDDCATLDLARHPLATALGSLNYERNRNGEPSY